MMTVAYEIPIGVIGSGKHGALLIEKMQKMGIPIPGVYGHKNRDRLKAPFMETVQEVMEVSQAVVLAIPPEHSMEVAAQALDMGRDVLVEKPITASYQEALTLLDIEGSSDSFVMAAHCLCYSDNIGEVTRGRWKSAFCAYRRPKSGSKMNAYWNLAVHPISVFTLAGVTDYEVRFTWSDTDPYTMMFFNDEDDNESEFIAVGDYFKNQFEHFIHCIRTREKPRTDLEHGAEVIKALEEYGGIYEAERGVQ